MKSVEIGGIMFNYRAVGIQPSPNSVKIGELHYVFEEQPLYTQSHINEAIDVAALYCKNVLHVDPRDKVILEVLSQVKSHLNRIRKDEML